MNRSSFMAVTGVMGGLFRDVASSLDPVEASSLLSSQALPSVIGWDDARAQFNLHPAKINMACQNTGRTISPGSVQEATWLYKGMKEN